MVVAENYSIVQTSWAQHAAELIQLRDIVFVQEQGVPKELEIDEHDSNAWHVLVRDLSGQAIATGRLLNNGHIGRVAVLTDWRGKGLGKVVMQSLIALAKQHGLPVVTLHAQIDALGFYEKLGFHSEGKKFIDAGIMHQTMVLLLTRVKKVSSGE